MYAVPFLYSLFMNNNNDEVQEQGKTQDARGQGPWIITYPRVEGESCLSNNLSLQNVYKHVLVQDQIVCFG